MKTGHRPVVLAILDGWGIARPDHGNAIAMASTPHMDSWMKRYPHSKLTAYGQAVGLMADTTGNSEVGHINLGAGFVVSQDEVRINHDIEVGTFFANTTLIEAFQSAKRRGSCLHLVGLVGPGEVHSRIDHLWSLLDMAGRQKSERVYVHLFSDGRDAPPTWLGKNAEAIQIKVETFGATVASLCGRYFAMDRNNHWPRTEAAYRLLTERRGKRVATLKGAVQASYDEGKTDEFILPTVIANGKAIDKNDVVIFFNFRTDRPRQLTEAFVEPKLAGFRRPDYLEGLAFYSMTQYKEGLPVTGVVYPPIQVKHPLAEVVSKAGMRQLHASETEKYAHVTFFINGGREKPFPGEDRLLIPSPEVATYDLQPEMSAQALTESVISATAKTTYDLVIMNYPNADMVGHSGNLEATIAAVESIDSNLGTLAEHVASMGGVLLITADHGNAEAMLTLDRQMNTQHHSADVPFMAIGNDLPGNLHNGVLANVAPTILDLMGLKHPAEMTASSLWEKKS